MILDRSLYTVFRNNIFRTRRLSETMPSFLPSVLVKPDQQDYEFTGYLEEEKEYAKENKSVDEAQIVNIDEIESNDYRDSNQSLDSEDSKIYYDAYDTIIYDELEKEVTKSCRASQYSTNEEKRLALPALKPKASITIKPFTNSL